MNIYIVYKYIVYESIVLLITKFIVFIFCIRNSGANTSILSNLREDFIAEVKEQ